jgi:hypothetical protein
MFDVAAWNEFTSLSSTTSGGFLQTFELRKQQGNVSARPVMITGLFWAITQPILVIWVTNYHYSLRNNPKKE